MSPRYPFQTIEVYRIALDYLDSIYGLEKVLRKKCPQPLRDALVGAATQIVTVMASRSSGKTEIEKSFMVNGCLMSLYETIACLDIVEMKKYVNKRDLKEARSKGDVLALRLSALKKTLKHA